MKGVAFFSGGKDGLYALYLAERMGINVPYLIALKTTIGLSPHWENLGALKTLTSAMDRELLTFDMAKGSDALAELIGSLDVEYLIAGDVYLEDHLKWVNSLAEKARVEPLEPLWGRNTGELAREMLEMGFKWAIIAVDRERLGKEWLGYTFCSVQDLEKFLEANPGIDPVGEAGEFHTVVLESPLLEEGFDIEVKSVEESERYSWVRFGLVRE